MRTIYDFGRTRVAVERRNYKEYGSNERKLDVGVAWFSDFHWIRLQFQQIEVVIKTVREGERFPALGWVTGWEAEVAAKERQHNASDKLINNARDASGAFAFRVQNRLRNWRLEMLGEFCPSHPDYTEIPF